MAASRRPTGTCFHEPPRTALRISLDDTITVTASHVINNSDNLIPGNTLAESVSSSANHIDPRSLRGSHSHLLLSANSGQMSLVSGIPVGIPRVSPCNGGQPCAMKAASSVVPSSPASDLGSRARRQDSLHQRLSGPNRWTPSGHFEHVSGGGKPEIRNPSGKEPASSSHRHKRAVRIR